MFTYTYSNIYINLEECW